MAGPATGYDIKKILEQEVSKIVDVTISNIYPALNELADEGLVTFERIEQENRPNKKLYEITDAGRTVCINALMTCEARQRLRSEFMFMLSFAPYLPKSRIAELIDQRLADIEEAFVAIATVEKEGSPVIEFTGQLLPGQRFCVELGRTLVEAERDFILRNRDRLIAQAPDTIELDRLPASGRLRKVV
jgi:DNA-binding PadR family transcriptional regulator